MRYSKIFPLRRWCSSWPVRARRWTGGSDFEPLQSSLRMRENLTGMACVPSGRSLRLRGDRRGNWNGGNLPEDPREIEAKERCRPSCGPRPFSYFRCWVPPTRRSPNQAYTKPRKAVRRDGRRRRPKTRYTGRGSSCSSCSVDVGHGARQKQQQKQQQGELHRRPLSITSSMAIQLQMDGAASLLRQSDRRPPAQRELRNASRSRSSARTDVGRCGTTSSGRAT